jgi:hypothetical protein
MIAHKSQRNSKAKSIRLFLSDGLVAIGIDHLLRLMFVFAVSPPVSEPGAVEAV